MSRKSRLVTPRTSQAEVHRITRSEHSPYAGLIENINSSTSYRPVFITTPDTDLIFVRAHVVDEACQKGLL